MSFQPPAEIIIPAHNAGRYLLESVRSALAQTYSNLRVTVVDDGSTDDSIAQLRDIENNRLRVIEQPQSGKSAALNRAIAQSTAEFCAIQDADDVSHPMRIAHLVGALQRNPKAAAALSGHELIIDGRRVGPTAPMKTPAEARRDIAAFRMPAHDPTAMFRLSLTRGIPFEPSLAIGQGYDHLLRVGERFPMLVVGECLYGYRVHTDSNTQRDGARRMASVLEVIRRACARRGVGPAATQRVLETFERRLQRSSGLNNAAAHLMDSVLHLRDTGRPGEAWRTAWAAALLRPGDVGHYKPLIYAIAPRAAVAWWRRRRAADETLNFPPRPTTGAAHSTLEPKPDSGRESMTIHHSQKVQTHV